MFNLNFVLATVSSVEWLSLRKITLVPRQKHVEDPNWEHNITDRDLSEHITAFLDWSIPTEAYTKSSS